MPMSTEPPISELHLPDMQYIYIIENSINGKFYIGRTNKPEPRRRCHFSELRRDVHGNPRLQAAFNKYGEDAFRFQVVDSAPDEQIEEKEAEWFAAFDCDKSYLYNCHFETFGGPKTYGPMPEIVKAKVADAIRSGTRKYIFQILDEGFASKIGLNALARKHSVGSTTLLKYIPEWEILRGMKYGHPQSTATKERMEVFAEAYSIFGLDVMRHLDKFNLSVQAIKKYASEFGLNWSDLKLDQWKSDSRSKAFAAFEYKAQTNCTVQEAIRATGATTSTYYKYEPEWKAQSGAAMTSSERADKVVEMVRSGLTHMHGACKQWRIGRDTVKKYHPEAFA